MLTSNRETSVVVFDVDGTLIEDNIGLTFVKFLIKKRKVKLARLVHIMAVFLLYKLKILDFTFAIKAGAWALVGLTEKEVDGYSEECFREEIRDKIYTDAKEEIEYCRNRGAMILIATGAHVSIAKKLAEHLRLDGCVATSSRVENGRYSSDIAEPLPYGEGKKIAVSNMLDEKYTNSNVTVYTDEKKDLPLLSLGDKLVAVNADHETRSYVTNRGGRVVEFK
jgi:putative phosphoserine phosphatase / 1-acylglycerol-3-phosphate O-acyltransferase